MTKQDWISVGLCAVAAALCGVGSNFAAPMFCISSVFGLVQSIKNKAISAALINGIFLVLNLYSTFKILI